MTLLLVSNLLVLLYLLVFTIKGFQMAFNGREQISPLIGIKMTWPLAAVPAGGFLCVLQYVNWLSAPMGRSR
jgi:TRAP-type C4-dicarboxylate transport system permease small subunit